MHADSLDYLTHSHAFLGGLDPIVVSPAAKLDEHEVDQPTASEILSSRAAVIDP
jgi:hypothetical protein